MVCKRRPLGRGARRSFEIFETVLTSSRGDGIDMLFDVLVSGLMCMCESCEGYIGYELCKIRGAPRIVSTVIFNLESSGNYRIYHNDYY